MNHEPRRGNLRGRPSGPIGTPFFIVLVFHRPFYDPLGISADSFEHSLSVFESVDKGE